MEQETFQQMNEDEKKLVFREARDRVCDLSNPASHSG